MNNLDNPTHCFICKEVFKNNDVAVPLIIKEDFPAGIVNVFLIMHYNCGLEYYLSGLKKMDHILPNDKLVIVGMLMEALNWLSDDGLVKQ